MVFHVRALRMGRTGFPDFPSNITEVPNKLGAQDSHCGAETVHQAPQQGGLDFLCFCSPNLTWLLSFKKKIPLK